MGPVLQSASVCLLLLLLQLTAPIRGQYMSGYGTGPFIPELVFFGGGQDFSDDPKYDDAKSASLFAAFYYGQNDFGRNDFLPKRESPYKYQPPLFPSVALGTLPPPAQQYSPFPDYDGLPYFSK